jgi:hypothetical protein
MNEWDWRSGKDTGGSSHVYFEVVFQHFPTGTEEERIVGFWAAIWSRSSVATLWPFPVRTIYSDISLTATASKCIQIENSSLF